MQRVPLLKAVDGSSLSPLGSPRSPPVHSRRASFWKTVLDVSFLISVLLVRVTNRADVWNDMD